MTNEIQPDIELRQLVLAIGTQMANLASSINAIPSRGITPLPVPGASGRLSWAPGTIAGYSINTAGAAAWMVRLRDGDDRTDPNNIRATIAGPAAGSTSAAAWFLPGGLPITAGLFLEIVSGAPEGTIYMLDPGTP
jgi:hypothetical protein